MGRQKNHLKEKAIEKELGEESGVNELNDQRSQKSLEDTSKNEVKKDHLEDDHQNLNLKLKYI